MTAALTQGLERIPGQLGYLLISEDGVLAIHEKNLVVRKSIMMQGLHRMDEIFINSSGELENDERTAGVIMQMVRTACRFRLHGAAEPFLKRMSVMFEDYVYVVTISGQKVFVVKRQNNQREPVTAQC